MQTILVLGAGKIGTLIAFLLANSKSYRVFLADASLSDRSDLMLLNNHFKHLELAELNAEDSQLIASFVKKNDIKTIVASLPYFCNVPVATLARELDLNYFDLTEDTRTAAAVAALAEGVKTAFVPQCGLAPGFISIVANHLMQHFSSLETVKMRVGALPVNVSNALQYSLTWSIEGLINEYGNSCQALENGEEVNLPPLDDLEEIKIDGLTYEAFNTSGGIGSLTKTYFNKVKELTYKTIRYPGHCDKMRFLMKDLHLNHDRDTLKRILEKALPKTFQDVVLVYVSVMGMQNNHFIEETYVKKFYPKDIEHFKWSAIQMTTASGLCAVLDLVLSHPDKYKGFIKQEMFSFDELVKNRFGQYYS